MYEYLITCQSEKKYIWNWSKVLCIFYFFHELFYENINQEHNLLLDCAFEPFTYGIYAVKIACQTSLPSLLTWLSLTIFDLDQSENENCLFSSTSLSLAGEISHWCMYTDGSCRAICECNICLTSALKSVYGKSKSVIGSKLFSFL